TERAAFDLTVAPRDGQRHTAGAETLSLWAGGGAEPAQERGGAARAGAAGAGGAGPALGIEIAQTPDRNRIDANLFLAEAIDAADVRFADQADHPDVV